MRAMASRSVTTMFIALAALPAVVLADGPGLIGLGKVMYDPTCGHACRSVLSSSPLSCTPTDGDNHGSHHNPSPTPPECFVTDLAFLRTMAICMDTYCPRFGNPKLSKIEEFWATHLGSGSIGTYKYVPVVPYTKALLDARYDEVNGSTLVPAEGDHDHDHGAFFAATTLPTAVVGEPINVTSFVSETDFVYYYNGAWSFEQGEIGHTRADLAVLFVALFLPVVLSLFRFVPGVVGSRLWTRINATLNYPAAFGSRHREPVANLGQMPTRGQALYIFLISLLNIVLCIVPVPYKQPNNSFPHDLEQALCVIGDRAGGLAMANMVAVFVFSTRNNVLISLTNWSHSTFLLLHRWIAYWVIIHSCFHSAMLLALYKIEGMYDMDSTTKWWQFGILATVLSVAIWPLSVLPLRARAYELFLAGHQILVALFLVGVFLHIYYLFTYDWGYEIWVYIAGAIWFVDRAWRLLRVAFNGIRTAVVTPIEGSNGEYVRVEVEGVHAHGVAYLYFPSLTWRVWENHPFSVASSFSGGAASLEQSSEDVEKGSDSKSVSTASIGPTRPVSTFIARVRSGITAKLAQRLGSSVSLRLPVLVEGPYHSIPAATELAHCDTLIAIGGGVGITALLPVIHTFAIPRQVKLYWGVRHQALINGVAKELARLPSNVSVTTSVGPRLDVAGILEQHLEGDENKGTVGVIVCGPPGMADDVRRAVVRIGKGGKSNKAIVFVDDAFGW